MISVEHLNHLHAWSKTAFGVLVQKCRFRSVGVRCKANSSGIAILTFKFQENLRICISLVEHRLLYIENGVEHICSFVIRAVVEMLSACKGIVDGLVCSNGSLVPLLLVIVWEESLAIFVGEVLQLLVAVEEGRGCEE